MVVVLFLLGLLFGGLTNEVTCGECPMGCWCSNKFVDCTTLMEIPITLPLNTERIRLSQLNVRYIPPKSFGYLPHIQTIEITNSNIAYILPGAFVDLNNITKIFIDKSVIGNIESYAFYGVTGVEEIIFEKCRIGRIKPFAFMDVSKIESWMFKNVHIRNLYSQSFYNVSEIQSMVLYNNNISDFVNGAFDHVTNITTFEAHNNQFWNMHCLIIDQIMGASNNFLFLQNTFYCNCSVNWLVNNVGKIQYAKILQESRCHGPDSMNETINLSTINFANLQCKRQTADTIQTCDHVKRQTPYVHFPVPDKDDTYESYEETERQRNIDANKEDSNNTANSVTNTTILMLILITIVGNFH